MSLVALTGGARWIADKLKDEASDALPSKEEAVEALFIVGVAVATVATTVSLAQEVSKILAPDVAGEIKSTIQDILDTKEE